MKEPSPIHTKSYALVCIYRIQNVKLPQFGFRPSYGSLLRREDNSSLSAAFNNNKNNSDASFVGQRRRASLLEHLLTKRDLAEKKEDKVGVAKKEGVAENEVEDEEKQEEEGRDKSQVWSMLPHVFNNVTEPESQLAQ
jgi:hypothetical protein